MSNMLDYLEWRGDLSFSQSPFNEVDNLIMSMLSYIHFEGVVSEDFTQPITLKEAADQLFSNKSEVVSLYAMKSADFVDLLSLSANSNRFGGVKLMHFINKVDVNIQMQFSATVFETEDNTVYISFRGTDDTVVGWLEDFNMGVMKTIPSQEMALAYTIRTANRFSSHKLYLGGHSKGGNLAVYSALKAPQPITDRILHVYSNDGPGFLSSNIDPAQYQDLSGRITTFVPESSIIGMLLDHEEDYVVVKSVGSDGLTQHNAFLWDVSCKQFVHLKDVNKKSKIIDMTIKNALERASDEDRIAFVEAFMQIVSGLSNKTLTEMSKDKMNSLIVLAKGYEKLSPQNKNLLNKAFQMVFEVAKKNIIDMNNTTPRKGLPSSPKANVSFRKPLR